MSKTILIAPLNWGLGHASRCMPLIDEFLKQGANVMLASDGEALKLLQAEYPQLPVFELPPYNIRYPFSNMILSMASQMPKILRGGIGEYLWLRRFLKNHDIDMVISDNRFGFFNKKAYCIFMTHQVNIIIPNTFLQKITNWINHFFIKKFHRLWIPDFENEPNLSGILAHKNLPKFANIQYLGALTRMKQPIEKEKIYRAIVVLSGPEPQRTYLEEILLEQMELLSNTEQKEGKSNLFLMVRGVMSDKPFKAGNKNIKIYNYLKTKELQDFIAQSEVLICRSGYSTIMDLVRLKTRAILIPTPGQTEQKYLAKMLKNQKLFYTEKQSTFSLKGALEEVKRFSGFINFDYKEDTLSKIISDLLKK